jgi:dynactin complex subunit
MLGWFKGQIYQQNEQLKEEIAHHKAQSKALDAARESLVRQVANMQQREAYWVRKVEAMNGELASVKRDFSNLRKQDRQERGKEYLRLKQENEALKSLVEMIASISRPVAYPVPHPDPLAQAPRV